MTVFFAEEDYELYRGLLAEQAARYRVECWSYCLMPNHVHVVAVPADEKGLSRAFGEAHRRYALIINEREGWRGHLWQERFFSCAMSELHLYNTVRYVLTNPLRAGLVANPEDWPHSSYAAQVIGRADPLVERNSLGRLFGDWRVYLGQSDEDFDLIRRSTRTGRPLGDEHFLRWVEETTGRSVGRRPPGPKRHSRE